MVLIDISMAMQIWISGVERDMMNGKQEEEMQAGSFRGEYMIRSYKTDRRIFQPNPKMIEVE